jgi:hypothetical protein
MSAAHPLLPAHTSLVHEAAVWLTTTLARSHDLHSRTEPSAGRPLGFRGMLKSRLQVGLQSTAVARHGTPIDLAAVERMALQQLAQSAHRIQTGDQAAASPAELVDGICRGWARPDAGPLALAWLSDDDRYLKGARMDALSGIAMDVALIAAGVAAAVLALTLIARRSGAVAKHGRAHRVSDDFAALQRIRDEAGAAAGVADRLIRAELSPGAFRLEAGLEPLTSADRRALLAALAPLGVGVERIVPAPGAEFVAEQMSSARVMTEGTVWVVENTPPDTHAGYRRGARTLLPAHVEVCTADWWCVALAEPTCPIATALRADPERYTGNEPAYAYCWSSTRGFSALTDLRDVFDEPTLHRWAEQLRERLEQFYPPSSGHVPQLRGAAGERYDGSVMRTVEAAPVADARVAEVVTRDELPQRGLGCPGAPPLLYALVRVEEA